MEPIDKSGYTLFQREPVLVILNGFAGAVSLTLVAMAAVGTLSWDASTIALVVAGIEGWTNLFGMALRAYVWPDAKVVDMVAARDRQAE